MRRLLKICAFFALASICFVAFCNLLIIFSTRKYIFTDSKSVQNCHTAICLGARVYKTKTVSHVFRDRIEGAMKLKEEGKVKKILISGDHGRKDYDEVNSALKYLSVMHNFEDEDIFLDHAGFSTYDTMRRARDVFCVTDCVVVTQRFHLARSVWTARALGLDATGFVSEEIQPFARSVKLSWEAREVLARVKAVFDVARDALHLRHPKYLGEKIPITGDGRLTRD